MENRRAELQAKAILAEARGEVEAARKALLEEQAGWARTLADQMRQFDLQAADLQREIAAARAAFIGSLAALAAGTGAARPLDGRTFTLPDPQPADSEACRLLAESLGAALVPAGGERLPGPAENLTDLERRLRQAALQDVLIKCDGLYRRKADRPGIAVSAFEVHARGQVICRGGNVTCSGRAAGSLMAEYGAAAMALRWLYAAGLAPGSRAEIWIDCRPLVLSLRRKHAGQRKRGCVQLDRAAKRLLHALHLRGCAVEIRWVPRDEVYAVDRLCDLVYREAAWYHRRRNSVYNVPLRRFLRSARLHG
jgi:ribonuclease HI